MTFDEPIRLLGWEDLRARGIKDSKGYPLPQDQSREIPAASLSRQISRLA